MRPIIRVENLGKEYRTALLAIFVVVFAVALRASTLYDAHLALGGDESDYDHLARKLLAGEGFVSPSGSPTALRTPGFPLILAGVYSLFGDDLVLSRRVLAVLSAFTALFLFGIGKLLFPNNNVALVAAVGWAAMVNGITLAEDIMGEASAAVTVSAAILLSVASGLRKNSWGAGLAGLLTGFAILIRGYLLLVPIGPTIWLWNRNRRLAILYIAGATVLPLFWAARNAAELGMFTLSTQPPREIWCGNNAWARGSWIGQWTDPSSESRQYIRARHAGFETLSEAEQSEVFKDEFVAELTGHPRRLLWLLPRKTAVYFSPISYMGMDWVFGALLPFSLTGAVYLAWRPECRQWLWITGFPIVAVWLVCLLTFGDPRFRAPVDPFFAILAALAFCGLTRRFITPRSRMATSDVAACPT